MIVAISMVEPCREAAVTRTFMVCLLVSTSVVSLLQPALASGALEIDGRGLPVGCDRRVRQARSSTAP